MASNRVLAMVMAGGKGERLYPLTEERSKPAVPFGGNFKLIDITLSNCINYGIHIFNCQTLIEALQGTEDDFGRDIIPKLIKSRRIFAYSFVDEEKGTPNYWRYDFLWSFK